MAHRERRRVCEKLTELRFASESTYVLLAQQRPRVSRVAVTTRNEELMASNLQWETIPTTISWSILRTTRKGMTRWSLIPATSQADEGEEDPRAPRSVFVCLLFSNVADIASLPSEQGGTSSWTTTKECGRGITRRRVRLLSRRLDCCS